MNKKADNLTDKNMEESENCMETKQLAKQLQNLEVKYIQATTELRGDIRLLTSEVRRLSDSFEHMMNIFVTKEEYAKDMLEINRRIEDVKRAGNYKSVALSFVVSVVTAVIIFELTKAFAAH